MNNDNNLKFNKMPAEAFTSPAEKKIGTIYLHYYSIISTDEDPSLRQCDQMFVSKFY